MRLEGRRDAGEGAAGADELAEGVDLAAGLRPQLLTGAVLVGAGRCPRAGTGRPGRRRRSSSAAATSSTRARSSPETVARPEPAAWSTSTTSAPEGPHHAGPARGVALGHDGDERVAVDGADDGEAGAGVAAGQLDDRSGPAEPAVGGGVLDHLAGDAVLLRAAGVQVVELGQDASRETRA